MDYISNFISSCKFEFSCYCPVLFFTDNSTKLTANVSTEVDFLKVRFSRFARLATSS